MLLDRVALMMGLLAGFLIATALGAIMQRINLARYGTFAPDRPMTIATQNTPRTIMHAAAQAARDLVAWTFALLCFVGFVAAGLYVAFFYG